MTSPSDVATLPRVTALVVPVDPEKPVRRVTVEWDQATADDHTDPSDADVFIAEVLRHVDPQKRYQLDSEVGPLGTRVWWVPQYFWAPGERPVNQRAEWFLGATGVDSVRSDLVITGTSDADTWPASVPTAVAELIEAGA